jgi:hypothetical protein
MRGSRFVTTCTYIYIVHASALFSATNVSSGKSCRLGLNNIPWESCLPPTLLPEFHYDTSIETN